MNPITPVFDELDAAEHLRIACRAAGIGVWQWDLVSGVIAYSALARGICGFTPDEVITIEKARSVTHPDDLPRTSALARRSLDHPSSEHPVFRYRIVRADTGEVRWVLAYGEAVFERRDGRDVATHFIGTIQDITDQKQAEDALTASEARLRLAVEVGQMAVWELDMETDTITPSVELNRLCGFPDDAQPTAQDFRSRYAPGEHERLQAEGAAAQARGETKLQTVFRQLWPDGTEKWLLLRAQLVPTEAQPRRVLGALIDVTESKRQEERLAALAQEMRHRLLNAVAVISAMASSTFRKTADPVAALRDFRGRLNAMGQATALMFAQKEETVALRELVEMITAPHAAYGEQKFALSGDHIEVSGSRVTAIAMALHELCTNAVKYGALSCGDGTVTIQWQRSDDYLVLNWSESGGPPVEPPTQFGFGSTLLQRTLFYEPDRLEMQFSPGGVTCSIMSKLDD